MNILDKLSQFESIENLKASVKQGIVKFPNGLASIVSLDNRLSKSGHPTLEVKFQSLEDDKAFQSEFMRTSTVARFNEKLEKFKHIIDKSTVSDEAKHLAFAEIQKLAVVLKEGIATQELIDTPQTRLLANGITPDMEGYQEANQEIMDELYAKYSRVLDGVTFEASFNTLQQADGSYKFQPYGWAGNTLAEVRSTQQAITEAFAKAVSAIINADEDKSPTYDITMKYITTDSGELKSQRIKYIKSI